MPLHVLGLNYALIAEVDAREAFAPAKRLFRWMLALALVLAGAALLVSFLVASSIARPVGEITERLEGLAQHLLSDSQEQQAGAAEQSAAVEETRQTFQGLLEASTSMNQIGTDVLGHAEVSQRSAQTIGARIQDLSASATTITEVLTLVKDIANKSEILALNAALEGTKAGEVGRGFSLVAQQMQRLAEQVMGSVKKIEGLTADISGASSGAVLAAEEAEKVSRLTTDAAREISGAVGRQQSSAEQVAVAMNEIAHVAGRNVEAARSVVTSSNDLLSLAERLRATVGVKG
jgi:methyl-accepting chemotaxis protein